MATPIPTPKYIIIWLDQHIGYLENNKQLKLGVSEQTDPKERLPESPFGKNINDAIQFKMNMEQSFQDIPKNLKAFYQKVECLQCIDESLKNNLKIFFITSGSLGSEIAQDLIQKYNTLKNIYVFCGYYEAHLDWVYDCLEHGINCLMYDFHTDLLVRLLRDVAEYFITEGDQELRKDELLAYSALEYFGWSKSLLHRANNFDMKKIFVRMKYVEERIAHAESLIIAANGNPEDRIAKEAS